MIYFFVGLAGSLGAILRYLIGLVLFNENNIFPFATLTINLIGSFLLAWFITWFSVRFSVPTHLKIVIGTGFVGSFTTFSTLSVETVSLFEEGSVFLGIIYVVASVIGGLFMSRLGFRVRKDIEVL